MAAGLVQAMPDPAQAPHQAIVNPWINHLGNQRVGAFDAGNLFEDVYRLQCSLRGGSHRGDHVFKALENHGA